MESFDTQRMLEIVFLVVIIGAIARKASSIDAAITSIAPQVYTFTNLLQGAAA